MESITTCTHAKIVDSWVGTLQKLKSTQGITENIEQKTVKANTEKSYEIFFIFFIEILLLMTTQMQIKTGKKKTKKDEKLLQDDSKEDDFC